jgi:HEPN domain-containing protein
MSEGEREGESQRWLRYARENLQLAQRVLERREDAPRQACFLAQQSAGKAIKALLVLAGVDFPKTHDLNRLAGLLPEGSSAPAAQADLSSLSHWAVEARYPHDVGDASWDDAERAVTRAAQVFGRISQDFGSRA